jgi:antitoxin component YwqK of YwqJK toxin-antitoxin module
MIRYYESGGLQAILEFGEENESTQAKLYYEDGEISAEGKYIKTVKDSLWKYYSFWTGALVSEEFYINGKKNGLQKSYYASGNVSEEIEYKNDIKDGTWTQYFEDGKKKLEASYRWNKVNGRYTFYHPTGNIYILGSFDENKRHGTWTFYDDEGKEKYKLRYNLGTLNDEDKELIEEKDTEFFKMVDENIGKFEEPSIENFFNKGPM